MLALFPDIFPRLVLLAKEKTAAVAGTGALFLIVTPVAAIFAMMFLPLTFILIALFLILLYISKIFTGYIIGDFIMQKVKPGTQSNRFLVFLIGFIILSLLIKVPFLGFFVGLISAILGCGALIYHLFKLRKNGNVETA